MDRIWDPYHRDNIVNPYQMYDRIREEQPVFQTQTGEWIITRYEDVINILGDERFRVGNRLEWMKRQLQYLKDDRVDFQSIVDAMNSFLVLLNPPEHTKIRSMVSSAWNDHNIEGIILNHIERLINDLNPEFDLVNDFAVPLPVMTICSIMGIDLSQFQRLKELSAKMIQSFNLYTSLKELVLISEAAREFIQFFKEYLQHRKANPAQDLVSKILIENDKEDTPLTEKELISVCIFLFVAGEETTVNLIGNGILALLSDRSRWEELVSNHELAGVAINEILRYDAPVQLVGRIASQDYYIRNHYIPRGSAFTLLIGAANRDPEKFEDPNHFSYHRTFKQHLSFGRGKHFCLGSWLAKQQGELAIKALATTFPHLALKQQKLNWNNHLAVRGLRSLKLEA